MNIWTLFAHIVVSLIIIAIITKFVWKPTTKFIDKNKAKMDREHRNLILYNRETKYHLDALKKEKARLALIRREEETAIAKKAEKLILESKEEAKKIADAIRKEAEDRVRALEAKSKEEIKKSVVNLSIELTEKLLGENINNKNSKKVIDTYIDELEKRDLSSQKFN